MGSRPWRAQEVRSPGGYAEGEVPHWYGFVYSFVFIYGVDCCQASYETCV
jgi:hypothetical protein